MNSRCLNTSTSRAVLAILALTSAWPALAQNLPATADAQASPTSDQPSNGIADIVVTAQKRSENLQNVPIAISAFSAETIRTARINDITNLNTLAPGLNVNATVGGSQSVSFSLRGENSLQVQPGTSPGIALYIDGVYQGQGNGDVVDFADVERIEVLRGPQGTLFGRNSNGGAIDVITKDPTGVFDVHQELTYGNYDQFREKTRIDLPAIGRLSLSGTFLHNERRGDTRNLGAGTQWNYGPATGGNYGILTSPKYLGDDNSNSVFVAAKLDLDKLKIVYKYIYSHDTYTDVAQGVGGFGNAANLYTINIAKALYAAQPAALRTPIQLTRPDAVNNAWAAPSQRVYFGHTLTGTYSFNNIFTAKDIFSYQYKGLRSVAQLDGFGFAGTSVPGPALGGPAGTNVATLIGIDSDVPFHSYSNELTLNANTHWANITAGYYYYKDDSQNNGFANSDNVGLANGGVQFYIPPLVPGTPIVLANTGRLLTDIVSRSQAVFGQADIHVLPNVDITLGARETWDKKSGLDNNAAAFQNVNAAYSKATPTYLAGVDWHVTSSILAYAKYSTGYISGGTINAIVYLPESAKSFEAGLKGDFLDHHLRTNVAAYHVTYKNIQLTTEVNDASILSNAGDSRANGIEFEATVAPVHGLTISGNFDYLNFKYTRLDASFLASLGIPGYAFEPAQRPKFNASISPQFTSDELPFGGNLYFRIDANYRGSYFSTFAGYDDNGDGKFNSKDATWALIHQSPTWIVNGRAALTKVPVAGAKAELALFAQNIFNVDKPNWTLNTGFSYEEIYYPARTFGAELTVDF